MSPIRRRLLRYQSHELKHMAMRGVYCLLFLLILGYLWVSKAEAESTLENTAQKLGKVSAEFHQLSLQYIACLNGEIIGRNSEGVALMCGEVLEIKT